MVGGACHESCDSRFWILDFGLSLPRAQGFSILHERAGGVELSVAKNSKGGQDFQDGQDEIPSILTILTAVLCVSVTLW
jgi:hypothetical protein